MTEIIIRTRAGIVTWVFLRGRRCQRGLSTRVHATGDERARRRGWEVMEGTGRFGFGARTYRDPLFNDRRRQYSPAGSVQGQPQVRPRDIPRKTIWQR